MKLYDEIKYYGDYWGLPIYAFNKIDGNNLRFGYNQKRGFYKFGTRQMMIDHTHDEFGFAVKLFMDKYSEPLTKAFKQKQYRDTLQFTCFAELAGAQSEFGQHQPGDQLDLTLFDIDQDKKGLIHPKQFIKDFEHVGIPEIVYTGNLTKEFIKNVKYNNIPGFNLKEGIVGKGTVPNRKDNNLFYFKAKTDEWFERLRIMRPDLYIAEMKQALKPII